MSENKIECEHKNYTETEYAYMCDDCGENVSAGVLHTFAEKKFAIKSLCKNATERTIKFELYNNTRLPYGIFDNIFEFLGKSFLRSNTPKLGIYNQLSCHKCKCSYFNLRDLEDLKIAKTIYGEDVEELDGYLNDEDLIKSLKLGMIDEKMTEDHNGLFKICYECEEIWCPKCIFKTRIKWGEELISTHDEEDMCRGSSNGGEELTICYGCCEDLMLGCCGYCGKQILDTDGDCSFMCEDENCQECYGMCEKYFCVNESYYCSNCVRCINPNNPYDC